MKMFDHDPSATVKEHIFGGNQVWTTWAPMLALQTPDPALALPEGTELQPQVLMRNTTPQVQAASLSFTWRGDTKKGNVALPPMQLKPFETVLLDVKALQQQGRIPPDAHWALVKISSPTAKLNHRSGQRRHQACRCRDYLPLQPRSEPLPDRGDYRS
jgi:hypothetical protein